MGRIPTLGSGEVIRTLQKLGFEVVRQRGSHVRLKHPDQRTVTIPVHPGQDIGRGLLRKILRDAEITPAEFLDTLQD